MLLKEFRRQAKGLPDLLPWAALIDNGVVLTKSGGLLAGFEFRGPDLDSATKEELAAVSARINAALALDDGWSLHVDAVRRQSPGYPADGAFPDRTTRLLDDCRRLAHEGDSAGFQSDYRLVLCWHPDPDAAAKAEMLFVDGAQKTGVAERSLVRFKTAIAEIESRLAGTLKIRRLVDQVDEETGAVESQLLAHLAACVTLEPRPSFVMGMVPMYLDSVLGQHDFVTGFQPRIDDKTAICIAVTGFPGTSFPGILDFLSRLAPMFRPDPLGKPGMVELCGVQHLMPKVAFSTDKIMAKGSRTVGAFVPFPAPDSLMRALTGDSLAPLQAWLAVADKTKPLVICEGVATGLAIQQSGAGNTLCALSSNNVVAVARWVKKSGLSDLFPGVVVATDHDFSRDAAGRLKSNAIPRALEAAKVTGFDLAVPPATSQVSADARDLLGQGGPQAVRNFISSAAPAADVEKSRADIFLSVKKDHLAVDPEFER
jgi:hypothetical protein